MNALDLARQAFIAIGAKVDVLPAVVTAEQSLDLVDIIRNAAGELDMNRPARAIARDIRKIVARKITFDNVIFSAVSSTRGARAGTRPFVEFLHAAGFTTPFMYTTTEESRPAYRTANWQLILIYENHIGVGNIGRVSIVELRAKRRNPEMNARSVKKLLAQYAENVPNERGVTRAQKQAGKSAGIVAPAVETEDVIPEAAVEAQDPVDIEKAKGRKFNSFQDLAGCLL